MTIKPKKVTGPPTFTDREHRTWTIDLTGAVIERVMAATHVDLLPDNSDYSPIGLLICSHRKLGNVLWAAVKPLEGIDRLSFLNGMDGQAYLKGWEALVDAIYFFILQSSPGPNQQMVGDQFLKVIETMVLLGGAQAELALENLRSPETTQRMNDVMQSMSKEAHHELLRALDDLSVS